MAEKAGFRGSFSFIFEKACLFDHPTSIFNGLIFFNLELSDSLLGMCSRSHCASSSSSTACGIARNPSSLAHKKSSLAVRESCGQWWARSSLVSNISLSTCYSYYFSAITDLGEVLALGPSNDKLRSERLSKSPQAVG